MGDSGDLDKAIEAWFDKHEDDPNIWRTPLGKAIKDIAKRTGNWKNAPRGNASKAGRASARVRYKEREETK